MALKICPTSASEVVWVIQPWACGQRSHRAPLGKIVEPDRSVSLKDRGSIVVEQIPSAKRVAIVRLEE